MSSKELYSMDLEGNVFGYFRDGYNPGYWICTQSIRAGGSNIVCCITKNQELTREARRRGASADIFRTPEKPKPVSVGRGPSKKSLGVKLFG